MLGIGIETIAIGPVNLTGMSLAVIAGIILNLILHENEKISPEITSGLYYHSSWLFSFTYHFKR